MPACPNCGRQTLRTIDWACQWCGYPLMSRAYKKIDKTFKELEEERNAALQPPQPEAEPELEPEVEEIPGPPEMPVSEPKPEPPPPPEPEPEPETPPAPEPEPEEEESVIQLPPPEPEPQPEPEPEPAPEPEPKPKPKAKSKSKKKQKPEPEPEAKTEPETVITPPPQPEEEPLSPEKPEIEVESEPAPAESRITLDDIKDDVEITVNDVDALFRDKRTEVNAKLKDKTLVVKGIVEKVFVREHLDIRYIVLTGTSKRMMWSLRCTFDKEESPKLTRLSDGQEVKVRGKYDGYSKNVMFKECTLL